MWIFYCRKINNSINIIHARVFRIFYSIYESSFNQLLLKDNSFKIHHRNLQKLAVENFKVKINIAPALMDSVIQINEICYVYRSELNLKAGKFYSACYYIETVLHVGPKSWNSISIEHKECNSLNEFKAKTRTWHPVNSVKDKFHMKAMFRARYQFFGSSF